ncbi:MAG: hypothetical protein M1510_10565, partial [Nitrospirae bacterium]|nr:hypothetical protein [Nitrospirota bacterium]
KIKIRLFKPSLSVSAFFYTLLFLLFIEAALLFSPPACAPVPDERCQAGALLLDYVTIAMAGRIGIILILGFEKPDFYFILRTRMQVELRMKGKKKI